MSAHAFLVTGFGPFPGVARNPSGEVAAALAVAPPPQLSIVSGELPVVFDRVASALDDLLAGMGGSPAAVVGLGVQPHPWFRLERRARAVLSSEKPDCEGVVAGSGLRVGERELATDLDLEALAEDMRSAGAGEVRVSEDAGGYVCECTYHHILRRSGERGIPGLFLHIPPEEAVAVERQVQVVGGLLLGLARELRSR